MEGFDGKKFEIRKPKDTISRVIYSKNDWGEFVGQLINSYLVRGEEDNYPKPLFGQNVSNEDKKSFEGICENITSIFDKSLVGADGRSLPQSVTMNSTIAMQIMHAINGELFRNNGRS